MGSLSCLLATTLGCPSTNTTADAGMDAVGAFDVGSDAGFDVGSDAGFDVGADAPWPTATNTEYCPYNGYASPCRVPCEAPPEARFTVVVHWDAAYCCTVLGGPYETFTGCRCVSGFAECPRSFDYWSVPQSTCEFCARDAMGSSPDAFIPDAG
jgi:hypothetical protein